MPFSDKLSSSVPFVSFRLPILTMRGDKVHLVRSSHDFDSQDLEFKSFQEQVFTRFNSLLVADDEFLSISWIKKLLDAFASCQEDFRVILCNNKADLSKPPIDKCLSEFFDRSIKALDICNATRGGIERIRQWEKHLEIVLCALDCNQKLIGEGQFRRARKALMNLAIFMVDDKETGSVFSRHNRSFGRL